MEFVFDADWKAPVSASTGVPGLKRAARNWCESHTSMLGVSMEECRTFLATKAMEQVVQARSNNKIHQDPEKGLAPGLLVYQAAQMARSRYHDKGDAPVDRAVKTEAMARLSWSPSIMYLPGFVDHQTSAEIIRLAKPLLQPSQAIDEDDAAPLHRNSSTAMLRRQDEMQNPLVRDLTDRVHNLMNLPPDHGEGLQVAHYKPGQSYGFHADAFEGAPRAFTFLAFLNSPGGGGETIFPLLAPNGSRSSVDPTLFRGKGQIDPELFASLCDKDSSSDILRVHPKQGDAILFTPMRPWLQNDERAIHGACHVTAGEKWVVQRWARGVYDPGYAQAWVDEKKRVGRRRRQAGEEL